MPDNSFRILPLDGILAIEATLESVSFEGKPNTNSFFISFDEILVRRFPTGYVSLLVCLFDLELGHFGQ